MKISHYYFAALAAIASACGPMEAEFILVQINDTYEIAPHRAASPGGLARAATLVRRLEAENPNVWVVHAGDFLTPSSFSALRDSAGNKLAGREMVEVLNALGTDVLTFGNHEFDVPVSALLARIDETEGVFISNNCRYADATSLRPFKQRQEEIPPHIVLTDKLTGDFRLGISATTLPYNNKDFVAYLSPLEQTVQSVSNLRELCDVVVLLTHQSREDDSLLALKLPEVPLIMGGHEHYGFDVMVGNTRIAKAQANARTLWVHRIKVVKGKPPVITSESVAVTSDIPEDAEVAEIVNKWRNFALTAAQNELPEPQRPVATVTDVLDARETSLRSRQTNFGALMAGAVAEAVSQADLVFINSGSLRYDEEISGNFLALDIVKSLPFGGGVTLLEMPGSAVMELLEISASLRGTGAYLQYYGLQFMDNQCWVNNTALDTAKVYKVAMSDYLAKGREKGMDFLAAFPATRPLEWGTNKIPNDLRLIFTKALSKKYPPILK
jgi:5'-nucleotidase